jgi:hypothetical protein
MHAQMQSEFVKKNYSLRKIFWAEVSVVLNSVLKNKL